MLKSENYKYSISCPNMAQKVYNNFKDIPIRDNLKYWILSRQIRNLPIGMQNTNDYEEWWKSRKILNDSIFKPQEAAKYVEIINNVSLEFLENIN